MKVERRGWRLEEIREAYGISVSFLRKEIREGRLRVKKMGSCVIVLVEEWERYMGVENEENKEK